MPAEARHRLFGLAVASGRIEMSQVYLPCQSGIIAVRATSSPPALHLLWSSGIGGGPPIVAAGLVWTIGPNGVLYASTASPRAAASRTTFPPALVFAAAVVVIGVGLALSRRSRRDR